MSGRTWIRIATEPQFSLTTMHRIQHLIEHTRTDFIPPYRNHYGPHMRSSTNHSAFTERVTLPSPQQNSNHTVDAGSSIYQHAQNSLVAIANSTRSSIGNMPMAAPPIANDSPWSFIQSVTKGKDRRGDLIEGRGKEAGERERVSLRQNKKPCSQHSHCHHYHHSHCHHHSPSSHLHRSRHSPHRYLSNHLHKANIQVCICRSTSSL